MNFKIIYKKAKSPEDAFEQVQKLLQRKSVKKEMKVFGEVSIKVSKKEKLIKGQSQGSSFTLSFQKKSAHANLEISFFMQAFKKLFLQKLEMYLLEVL